MKTHVVAWARIVGLVGAIASAVGISALSGGAAAQGSWKVTGSLVGKVKKKDGPQPSQDVSGMACAPAVNGSRKCLIVDDEAQGAQAAVLKEGEIVVGDQLRLIDDALNGKPIELDPEAVAYADGFFYVIGSHGRSRHPDPKDAAEDEAKAKADKHVFRIAAVDISDAGKLAKGWKRPASGDLTPSLKADYGQPLKNAFDQPLRPNGLTIEGLAVRKDLMFVGFRGPVFAGGAQVLAVPLSAVFDHKAVQAELISLDLGEDRGVAYPGGTSKPERRGIRDLVARGDGFLVLAGPENDPDPSRLTNPDISIPARCGDYAVYQWQGPGSNPVKMRDLDAYADKIKHDDDKPPKPEGLVPLEGVNLRVLVVFDGTASGSPVAVELGDKFVCGKSN